MRAGGGDTRANSVPGHGEELMMNAHLDDHAIVNGTDRRTAVGGRERVPLPRAFELIDAMREDFVPRLKIETSAIGGAVGRTLAADVVAALDAPPFDISAMDGYAVHTADHGLRRLAGEVFAGQADRELGRGDAMYIGTGARLPSGANAVLKVEDAIAGDGVVEGPAISPYENVVRQGSDFRKGTVLVARETVVSPSMIGLIHASGAGECRVYQRPRFGVISTGDEIEDGSVRDINGPLVCAMLSAWGCEAVHVGSVGDSAEALQTLLDSVRDSYDALVTIGGVSVGRKDNVAHVALDGDVVFHGVAVRPGKPFITWRLGETPVFSLPGKPTGSFTAMQLLVRRFVRGPAPERTATLPISTEIHLDTPGFDYVVYLQLRDGRAHPVMCRDSAYEYADAAGYPVSTVASCLYPTVSDGYLVTHDHIWAGQMVTVHLI
jgi:molybdenum cofactor synthesis domain-containing protein